MTRNIAQAYLMAALAASLTLMLVFFPDASLEAARKGLGLFTDVVFPSLLPFFILSEVMLGLGVVHFIGVLFEPFMRPVFNVPGEGAFALSMGLAAGYPMDAVITGRFRRMNLCNRVEGERLLAFTNTADPLFIFGAVAVGMFGMAALGPVLALAHYLSALGVGLIFRYHAYRTPPTINQAKRSNGHIVSRAAHALVRAKDEDARPLGKLLGDSVNESIKTLFMICGFIMLFSAFVAISEKIGLAEIIGWPFVALFNAVGIDLSLVSSAVAGFFEIDLGTVAAAQSSAPFVQKALIAGAIIAWSGLSVHGQVASVITGTDIRMGPYFLARLFHAALAGIITFLLVPVMLGPTPVADVVAPLLPVLGGPGAFSANLLRGTILAAGVPLGLALVGAFFSLVVRPIARSAGPGRRASRSGSRRAYRPGFSRRRWF